MASSQDSSFLNALRMWPTLYSLKLAFPEKTFLILFQNPLALFHLLLYLSPSLKYWSSSCYHPLFSLLSMDLSSLVPPICPWFQLSPANPLCQATNLSRAPWLSFPVVFGICSWMAQRCLNKPCPKLNSSKPSFPVQSFSFPGDWCCHLPSSLGGGHLPTSESALTSESSLPGLKVLVSLYPKSPLN